MYIQSFKELIVWNKSMELAKAVYERTREIPQSELYGLTQQIRRAAVSIPSNIAEGSQRKNLKEYTYFLRISYGSAAELETQLLLTRALFPPITISDLESMLNEIQKMLNVMLKKLEARI